MRALILFLLLVVTSFAYSQEKFIPSIQKGTKMHYVVYTQGQEVPIVLTLDSLHNDFVKITWTIEGIGSGAWLMNKKSLEGASRGWWDQPMLGDQLLNDDQLVVLMSRNQWKSIQDLKNVQFDNKSYLLQPASEANNLKVSGKVIDALLLRSDGGGRIWILNNPSFPLLIKIEGNSAGPDLELKELH